MTQTDPAATTAGDIVAAALRDAGVCGIGQVPTAEELSDGMARLQWMLQQWERKRWLVYHLVEYSITSTGARSYTIGPGGVIDTGAGTVRPAKLESAFLRQIQNSEPNQIDYPIRILQSREDYNKIGIKGLTSFSMAAFLDSGWPLGTLYFWPVPQANIYELHVSVTAQLPTKFTSAAQPFALPYEYYQAMVSNLAIRVMPKYGKRLQQGDPVLGIAKDALNTMRGVNTQIAELGMPASLNRPGIYNIFSDNSY